MLGQRVDRLFTLSFFKIYDSFISPPKQIIQEQDSPMW
jgi:hypothetical protein